MNKKLAVFLMLAAFGLGQAAPVAAQTATPPAQTTPKKNTTPKKTTNAKKKTVKKPTKPTAKPKTSSVVKSKSAA